MFFEDSLPLPTLHQSVMPTNDANKLVVQQPPNIGEPTTAVKVPMLLDAPALTSHTVPPGPSLTSQPQLRLVVQLPGWYMDHQDAQKALIHNKPEGTDTAHSVSNDNNNESPIQSPIHNVGHIPDYPMRSLQSGLKRKGGHGGSGLKRGGGGGGSTMLVVDNTGYPPVMFLAGLPGGIQLLQLPNPQNVQEVLTQKDGGRSWIVRWRTSSPMMFTSLCHASAVCAPSDLVGCCITNSRTASSTKTRPD
jgi:hypothetical protein